MTMYAGYKTAHQVYMKKTTTWMSLLKSQKPDPQQCRWRP